MMLRIVNIVIVFGLEDNNISDKISDNLCENICDNIR